MSSDGDDDNNSNDGGDDVPGMEEDPVSSTWYDGVGYVAENECGVDDEWLVSLRNLVKIGRSFSFVDEEICEFFYDNVFPRFTDDLPHLRVLIKQSMMGYTNYYEMLQFFRDSDDLGRNRLLRLLEKVFLSLGPDVGTPAIEFERTFDLKTLRILDLATRTTDDEIQTTPAVTLAKRCALAPPTAAFERGSSILYGTNMLMVRCRNFKSRCSQSLMNSLEKEFRIIKHVDGDNNDAVAAAAAADDDDNIRLGCRVDDVEIYVTIGAINAAWTLDNDVVYKFVNVPSEPYPYDALCDISRIVLSVYIADGDDSLTETRRKRIGDDLAEKLLRMFHRRDSNRHHFNSFVISHFINYPLIAHLPTRRQMRCGPYRFHRYLQQFRRLSNWRAVLIGHTDVALLMEKFRFECLLVVYRPPLHSIQLKYQAPQQALLSCARIFTLYWSPDDIIELHVKLTTTTGSAFLDAKRRLKDAPKTICFKIYNGFLLKTGNDVDVELIDKYGELLHFWLATVKIHNFGYSIKTWHDDVHRAMLRSLGKADADVKRLKEAIGYAHKIYVVRNAFVGTSNAVNVSEVSNMDKIYTIFFDYPVHFFDSSTRRIAEIEEPNRTSNDDFKTAESLEEVRRTFQTERVLETSPGKYAIRLQNLPAVVAVGPWNPTDAANLAKFHNDISRNVLHALQSILCRPIVERRIKL